MRLSPPPQTPILQAFSDTEAPADFLLGIKQLFLEYQDFLGIPLDFQDFQTELDSLPGKYAPPRGNLYLVSADAKPVGCGAFYPLEETICEIKRLYLRPEARGTGLGKQLFERILNDASGLGYQKVRLDSLKRLDKAAKLYAQYGFYPIPPYNQNPHDDVYYLECDLQRYSRAARD